MKGRLSQDRKTIIFKVPMRFHRQGGKRMVILPEHEQARQDMANPSDDPMVNALSKARKWQQMLDKSETMTIAQLAEREGVERSMMARILRLTILAPDIIEAILDGRVPETFSLESLRESIPLLWSEQRQKWGFEIRH
ncbi:conserved hypothetical protein [Magnetococcus marinus MC-1]|uniref:ParB/Spo0J HTH domain-containing protein n=1 Tax=Magnetococcus marinus (strain ATCC BAA-1437 / JCM 17883 / MC-1) TaxID=156889 RepID=A0L9E6_MAGMM|nr:hypothetical protein [Magnetococcus marinus]ABK44589.1 conserved hypothetical protein [Magnetococcus marinus MC-1]